MAKYDDFIRENVATAGAKRIGVYTKAGKRVGAIPLKTLTPPDGKNKLYSFGALSDVHIIYQTAADDFKRALTYLNDSEDVEFTCIAGDLTDTGTAAQLAEYKAVVDSHSPDTPVYAIAGNHEYYSTTSKDFLESYTGKPLYYSFVHGEDVFIMCGCYSWSGDGVFTQEYLQWLYETLEANRNRRCFIFEHSFFNGDAGDACGLYGNGLLNDTNGSVFKSLLKHYKNTVLFHGHSHLKFHLQEMDDKANYSAAMGFRSVHIPSLAVPRDITGSSLSTIYADSEGYVVDVYENGIHLRGRDFVKGKFLPIASYWLDTQLQTVEAGTYTDSTGIIK